MLPFKSMFSCLSNCFIVCPSVADIAKYVSDDTLDSAVEKMQTGDPFFYRLNFFNSYFEELKYALEERQETSFASFALQH